MSKETTYDAKGDVLTDSLHSYAWDVETRPTTIDSVSVTYDALGRMVEQAKSGNYTEIVYDALGNKLALMNGKSIIVKVFAPLPGGATAVYTSDGLLYYRHPDWLGGSRFASRPSRTMYNDLAYTPFGIPYAQAGTTGVMNTSFAGNNEDTTTNLYDAQFREYEIYGRWPSPDPAGIAAANPANPQSWNRYAYVLNMPLLFVDPWGLDTPDPCSSADDGKSDARGRSCECGPDGCFWIPGTSVTVTVNGNPPPPISPITGPPPPTEIFMPNPQGPGGAPQSPGLFKKFTTYVSNEFKPGGCYNAFIQGAANANFLAPLAGHYGSVQAGGVAAVQGLAIQAGASSPALTGVSSAVFEAAPYALPVYGLYLGFRGLGAEYEAKRNGQCN